MKKNKISFETNFWAHHELENPFEVIDTFLGSESLAFFKQTLSEIVFYRSKDEVYQKECPGDVFFTYTAFRSFLRACSALQHKSKKWKVTAVSAERRSILSLASLTIEEYENPFAVFENAFAEHSLADFEFFLCEVIHLALRPTIVEFDSDLLTPYIHIIKMLDASQLLLESQVEKIKSKEP
ncbi:hypothetical protein [Flavobacterium hercynium]|uniref:Uncharacterized protein n=1 Tax=Flavobacterium hercynium TaxID=387094 RepID=A0A226HPM8_9FLAO|nr:hypothetical protein [Flavobacterium hercynium]OXA95571.1 hypothetical protein B0A66_02595 [Flavobacterium hercynium]SMP22777.1 hypothetical protein SAMN06265346_107197 [Flavobacterium hercynium]